MLATPVKHPRSDVKDHQKFNEGHHDKELDDPSQPEILGEKLHYGAVIEIEGKLEDGGVVGGVGLKIHCCLTQGVGKVVEKIGDGLLILRRREVLRLIMMVMILRWRILWKLLWLLRLL